MHDVLLVQPTDCRVASSSIWRRTSSAAITSNCGTFDSDAVTIPVNSDVSFSSTIARAGVAAARAMATSAMPTMSDVAVVFMRAVFMRATVLQEAAVSADRPRAVSLWARLAVVDVVEGDDVGAGLVAEGA